MTKKPLSKSTAKRSTKKISGIKLSRPTEKQLRTTTKKAINRYRTTLDKLAKR